MGGFDPTLLSNDMLACFFLRVETTLKTNIMLIAGRRRGLKAGEEVRTPDIHVGNVTLYQLSYARTPFTLSRARN